MKISYNWLKDYVDFDYTPQELAEKLTMVGIEVEEIISTVPEFSGVEVAEVLAVRKHPNADKLSLCDVKTAEGITEVICGAPNVAKGQLVAFAGVGTVLPNGIKIKKAKIRGVESVGMICSEEELGLADQSDGIWELQGDWEIGKDVNEVMMKNQDYILDLAITPNRPDAMSMIGIARDVAAINKTKYHYSDVSINEISDLVDDHISVENNLPEGCPRYTARIIRDVKIKSSPEWLKRKLESAGIRSINNIVDITNFVLMELGQPLHAFDHKMIAGNKIIVRESKPGEKFVTLDDKERELPEHTVMICDAEKSVAIGGIMGGLNSEVSETTTNILLESAYFNPMHISASSKNLGLSSEASQRFERGIDPNGVIRAVDRAAALIADLAEGSILSGVVDSYPAKIKPVKVKVRPSRINLVLGTDLSESEIADIFGRLEIDYKNESALIPTFRPDITREADLIEEIARMITFDAIPVRENTTIEYDVEPNLDDMFIDYLKSQLRELGITEVITNSMVSERETTDLSDISPVKILNPISDDMSLMRTSLLPGLLRVTAYNLNRNLSDLRIFEVGRVFNHSEYGDTGSQPYKLSGIINGLRQIPFWAGKSLPVDFYDLKGLLESFISKISLDKFDFILYDKNIYFDPDEVVGLQIRGKVCGHFGKINPAICEKFDISDPVYGFELPISDLSSGTNRDRLFNKISKFPYIEKDVAFIVAWDVPARDLKKTISASGRPLVNSIEIFDLYEGGQLAKDKKSIAFRIRFQSQDRTLQDKEVNSLFSKIISDVNKKYSATLRDE